MANNYVDYEAESRKKINPELVERIEEAIKRKLAENEILNNTGLVLYDPLGKRQGLITIGRTNLVSIKGIRELEELIGFKAMHTGNPCHNARDDKDNSLLYGTIYEIVNENFDIEGISQKEFEKRDFRKTIKYEPRQGNYLYIPIQGLVDQDPNFVNCIHGSVLIFSVETARKYWPGLSVYRQLKLNL